MADGRKNVFSCGWGDLRRGGAIPFGANFYGLVCHHGGWSIPMWESWIALGVAGGLSLLGLTLSER